MPRKLLHFVQTNTLLELEVVHGGIESTSVFHVFLPLQDLHHCICGLAAGQCPVSLQGFLFALLLS